MRWLRWRDRLAFKRVHSAKARCRKHRAGPRKIAHYSPRKHAACRTPLTVMLSLISPRNTICTTSCFAPRGEPLPKPVRSPSQLLQKLPRLPCRPILNVIKRLHEACEIFRRIDVIPALGTGYGEAGLLGTAPSFGEDLRGTPGHPFEEFTMQLAQAYQVITAVLRGP